VAITRPWSTTAISSASWSASSRYWRGEQDGDPAGDQVPDDAPHLHPAARVEPGGRLVQEQHPGPADQAGGQVQAPPHAAGVGLRRPVRGVLQPELGQQLGGPAPRLRPGLAEQPGDQHQVFRAGEVLVHRRVLPGQPDQLAHPVRVGEHVVPADGGPPLVRAQQGGQDAHRGGLAGPVRPEQAEDRAGAHGEIHAGQGGGRAEALDQPLGDDCLSHLHSRHLSTGTPCRGAPTFHRDRADAPDTALTPR
jgi:hypothetical protein